MDEEVSKHVQSGRRTFSQFQQQLFHTANFSRKRFTPNARRTGEGRLWQSSQTEGSSGRPFSSLYSSSSTLLSTHCRGTLTSISSLPPSQSFARPTPTQNLNLTPTSSVITAAEAESDAGRGEDEDTDEERTRRDRLDRRAGRERFSERREGEVGGSAPVRLRRARHATPSAPRAVWSINLTLFAPIAGCVLEQL